MKFLNVSNLHNFDEYIKNGKNVFVMFHMNGCKFCSSALPEWHKIKKWHDNKKHKLNNTDNVIIADIESSMLPNIKNSQNIEGYPTIRYIYNYGKSYEDFNGERVFSEFIKWIESKTAKRTGTSVNKMKGGKRNKTRKELFKINQQDNNKVDFDIDLFIKNLFTRRKK